MAHTFCIGSCSISLNQGLLWSFGVTWGYHGSLWDICSSDLSPYTVLKRGQSRVKLQLFNTTSLTEISRCFSNVNHFIHLNNISISWNSSKNLYQRMWAAERRVIADQRRPGWLALKAPASVPSIRCHQNHHHQGSNGHRDRHRCQNDLIGF